MLRGQSGGTGRTRLPVRRQLPRQPFLAALPGCEQDGDLVGWLASLGLVGASCHAVTGVWQGWGMVGTSHSIPSGGSAWQRCLPLPAAGRAGLSPTGCGPCHGAPCQGAPCHGAPSPAAGPCRQ